VGIVTFSFEKWYDEKGAHQNGMHEHRNGAPMQRRFRASSAGPETGFAETWSGSEFDDTALPPSRLELSRFAADAFACC